ncbi:hypothetical protein [Bacillus cereus]|uniref:hypothetical protein n=1 Tax=Bacillus cereus TaxID=1396 RepID=UPI000BFC1539|nr:hypothetical protein [Bacillus cereus]PGL59095.1 hypothetical protein CN927_18850 [Bacillus cereus]
MLKRLFFSFLTLGILVSTFYPNVSNAATSKNLTTNQDKSITLHKNMKLPNGELPLYAPNLSPDLTGGNPINYFDPGGGPCGTYCGWVRQTSYKYTADTSVPSLPSGFNLLKDGAARWIYAPIGDLFLAYDVAVYIDNTLANHRKSYGSIAVYKNPNASQWVGLWTVYDASGYLIYSKFGWVSNRPINP